MEHTKDFDTWNESKKKIHAKQELPQFSEYEIWWCSYGLNIGYEVDGKNELFERPVIVYKKHNKFTFLGIPTTTKNKANKWFLVLNSSEVEFILNFSQLKTFSSARLLRRMGKLSLENQAQIQKSLYRIFFGPSERPPFGDQSRAPMAN